MLHRGALVAASTAVFLVGARSARRGVVGRTELRCFQAVNRLPHRGFLPVWTFMQAGTIGGPLAIGAVASAAGRRRLGTRIALVGSLAWLGAKAVKPFVRRDRPALTVTEARVLGRAQRGLGYPSGHAAVAAAMVAVASPELPARWRPLAWAGALAIGPARLYVGAHLPLDVVGGVAFGIGIGTLARSRDASRSTPRSSRSS